MKKGKLFLATAFIPVMTGAALYFSSNTASAATPGWYDPMPWGSNGKCRVNWGGVVSSTINNMANSVATGFISGGRGWPR